jgi:hypothetical protein
MQSTKSDFSRAKQQDTFYQDSGYYSSPLCRTEREWREERESEFSRLYEFKK